MVTLGELMRHGRNDRGRGRAVVRLIERIERRQRTREAEELGYQDIGGEG